MYRTIQSASTLKVLQKSYKYNKKNKNKNIKKIIELKQLNVKLV